MQSKRTRQMATESRVQIEVLNTHNYGIWQRRIKALLLSKELWNVTPGKEDDEAKSQKAIGQLMM